MSETKKIQLGVLLFLLLSSGVLYVVFDKEDLKMRIDNDKSTFYTVENSRWVVSGREYNKIYDGTSLMNRDRSSIRVVYDINEDTNIAVIKRYTTYIRGPQIIDTYTYNGNISDKELFPISHTVELINASGYIYQYEVRDLVYSGETIKNVESPQSFGRKMKIEWDDTNYWSTIYKSGILKVRFRPESNYEIYSVRLFDPDVVTLTLDDSAANIIVEMGTNIDIVANITPDTEIVCVDINHPEYGVNYSCALNYTDIDFNPTYFRTTTFNDSTTFQNLTYIDGQNQTIYIDANTYDEVTALSIDISGYSSNGTYPEDVVIYIDDVEDTDLGDLIGTVVTFSDDDSSKEVEFTGENTKTVGYLNLIKSKDVLTATLNLTGSGNGESTFRQFAYKIFDYGTTSTWLCNYSEISSNYFDTTGNINITYGLKSNSTRAGSNLEIRHGDADTYNITLPAECWNVSGSEEVDFRMSMVVDGTGCDPPVQWSTQPQCYNGTAWTNIGTIDNESSSYGLVGNSLQNASEYISYVYDDDYGTGVLLPSGVSSTNVTNIKFGGQFESINGIDAGNFYGTTMFFDTAAVPYNPHLNVGANDDSYEWERSRDYMETSYTTDNFAAAINTYLDTCTADANGFCDVPIYFYTSSAGNLTVSDISIAYGSGASATVVLNATNVQAYLDAVTTPGATTIPIKIGASTNGTIEVDNLKYDYAGGNATYEILAHNTAYTVNTTYTSIIYYSDYYYNLTSKIDEIAFYPPSPTSTSVQPFGQTSSTPILNFTMENYGGVDANFSLYRGDDDSCTTLYYNLNSTKPAATSEVTSFFFNASSMTDTEGIGLSLMNSTSKNLTVSGATWTMARNGKNGLSFDGTNDYAYNSAFDDYSSSDEWTIMGWIKPNDVSSGRQELINLGGATLYQSGTSLVYAETTEDTLENVFIFDIWTHVAITRDDSANINLYVNRKLEKTFSVTVIDPVANITIAVSNDINLSTAFNGLLDDVKIFDAVLDESEIRDEMDTSNPTTSEHIKNVWKLDSSSGLIAEDTSYNIDRDGETVLFLGPKSEGQYLNFSEPLVLVPADGEIKIGFWFKLDETYADANLYADIMSDANGTGMVRLWLQPITTFYYTTLVIFDDNGDFCAGRLNSDYEVDDGEWHYTTVLIDESYACHFTIDNKDAPIYIESLAGANITLDNIGYDYTSPTTKSFYGGLQDIEVSQFTDSDYRLIDEWNTIKTGLSSGDDFDMWLWADYDCPKSKYYYTWSPYIYMRTCCENCTCDEALG